MKYLTPNPSTPEAVAEVVARLVKEAEWTGELGATFPAVIKNGVAKSAANVDKSWIETDVDKVFTDITHCDVTVLNDADAAGIAEARFGAARGVGRRGHPAHLRHRHRQRAAAGRPAGAQHRARPPRAGRARRGEEGVLGGEGQRGPVAGSSGPSGCSDYLRHVEKLFTPDLFVLGGGVSKNADKWVPLLDVRTPVKPAQLLNNAGIVGAAMAAHEKFTE